MALQIRQLPLKPTLAHVQSVGILGALALAAGYTVITKNYRAVPVGPRSQSNEAQQPAKPAKGVLNSNTPAVLCHRFSCMRINQACDSGR